MNFIDDSDVRPPLFSHSLAEVAVSRQLSERVD